MEILKDYLSQPPQGGYLNRLEGLEGPKEGIYGLSFSQDSHPEDGFTGSQLEDQVLCYTPLVLGGVLFLSLLSAYWREVRQRNKVGKQDSRLVAKEIDIYRGEEFGVKLNIGNPEYYPPYSAGEERVRRVDREETQADRRSGMTPKQLGLLRTAVKARISSDEERSHAGKQFSDSRYFGDCSEAVRTGSPVSDMIVGSHLAELGQESFFSALLHLFQKEKADRIHDQAMKDLASDKASMDAKKSAGEESSPWKYGGAAF